MEIGLVCDNLLTKTHLRETWSRAGATVRPLRGQTVDLIVVDLSSRDAVRRIGAIRAERPEVEIVAFGPHVDGDAFRAARAAGATKLLARGRIAEKILERLRSNGPPC